MIHFHSESIALEHLWQSVLIIIHKSLLRKFTIAQKILQSIPGLISFSQASETVSANAPSKICNNDHVVCIVLVMVLYT